MTSQTAANMILRQFSKSGPCIRLGEFVRATDKRLVYRDRFNRVHSVAKASFVTPSHAVAAATIRHPSILTAPQD